MGSTVLLVEDREGLRSVFAKFLRGQQFAVVEAPSVEDAIPLLATTCIHVVITDYMLPGANGLELLRHVRQKHPEIPVLVMTAFGEIKLAVEAIRLGASDFLEKPILLDHLLKVLERVLSQSPETPALGQDHLPVGEAQLVGNAPSLCRALELADRAAPSDANCMLLGESGVGKELFAQRIHQKSKRAHGELVAINCASIPADLLESELFGHERGAFTGAVSRKLGLVETADNGTLFLDEIGELPRDLQPKLLRFIQSRQYYRVGGNRVCTSNARIVCATNRDLKQGVAEGWFREDLFYRLAAFPIEIPPLRERPTDIPELAAWFLSRRNYPHKVLSEEVLVFLQNYPWPGNVRELETALYRAMILATGRPLSLNDFPQDMFAPRDLETFRCELDLTLSLKENSQRVERALEHFLIKTQLERHKDREQVATALGLSVKTLYNKIKEHGLEKNGS